MNTLELSAIANLTPFLQIHIVTFDEAGKISQIRLQWDQGSLLKQVEVIGKSGRNWPIRDSKEQIAFIQSCLRSAGTALPSAPNHNEVIIRTRGNSNNAMRDPHASLQLFGSREELEAHGPAGIVSPYAGTRPRQRDFAEILGDEPAEGFDNAQYTMSPSKRGQGKNFQPMRIFDSQEEHPENPEVPKEKRYIQPNPKKYSHFDFADGSDPRDAPQRGQSFEERPKSKHDSQWDFEDFVTPQKVKPSRTLRNQDVRHWDTDKDAVAETPVHQQPVKPRRDQQTHFDIQDEDNGANPSSYTQHEALGNITNLKGRGNTFDPHFNITDESPAHSHQQEPIPETRKKAVKMMNANWSSYDKSPSQKENNPLGSDPKARIHIAGDGMGSRSGADRDWLYGGASEEPIHPRKANAGNNNGINIAGDGMGGRKGTDRDWLYGETNEVSKAVPTRKPGSGPVQNDEPQKTRINIAGDGMGSRKGGNRDYLQEDAEEGPRAVPGRKPGSGPAESTSSQTGINIAGDGMGGRKGGLRDYLQEDSEAGPAAVPGRKPGSGPENNDTTKQSGINIAGDGMGGRKGGIRDYLQADAEEGPKAVPGRKPGSGPVNKTEETGINIAGDGMGGRKGTNRDWLYGEIDETAPAPAAPIRKQNNPNTTSKKDFWDF